MKLKKATNWIVNLKMMIKLAKFKGTFTICDFCKGTDIKLLSTQTKETSNNKILTQSKYICEKCGATGTTNETWEKPKFIQGHQSNDKNIILESIGESHTYNLKLKIFHKAKNGECFSVVDDTGELKEMIQKSGINVEVVECGQGKIKYIFNPEKRDELKKNRNID